MARGLQSLQWFLRYSAEARNVEDFQMQEIDRVEFWDRKSGSAYTAEWVADHWQFTEYEWNGMRVVYAPAMTDLLAQLHKLLNTIRPKIAAMA